MNQKENNIFVLKELVSEVKDVVTLKFESTNSSDSLSFVAGQYITVKFIEGELKNQSRHYTISSCPDENYLAITVKKIGKVSSSLHNLKIGDQIEIIGPFGYFYPEEDARSELVFLASGIGVAPFFSIIKDKSDRKISLFYSNKTLENIIFKSELDKLEKENSGLKIIHTLTKENENNFENGRINIEMLRKHLGKLSDKTFFLCGSIDFVNDMWKILKNSGVSETDIKTEAFY